MKVGLVLGSALLLAFQFAFSKKYQKMEGTGLASGLRFNILSGTVTALIFFSLSGFRVEFSWFSLAMAGGMAILSSAYNLVGFRVLESGNLALYSVFLMSGGMVLPYLFGGVFLQETFSFPHTVGMLFLLVGVVFSNRTQKSPEKTGWSLLGLCFLIFLINGGVSVVSKCHQISLQFHPVSSPAFVMYAALAKVLLSLFLLLLQKEEKKFSFSGQKVLGVVFFFSLTSGTAYLLQLIGAKTMPASVLYPMITGGSMVFSTLSGKVFFKETVFPHQWGSVAMCLVGTLFFLL